MIRQREELLKLTKNLILLLEDESQNNTKGDI